MKIDGKGRIVSFSEKPKGDNLKAMVIFELMVPHRLWTYTMCTLGSRHNSFGALKRRGRKETIHCFHGSLSLQEGDSSESFKVLFS